MTAVSAHAAVRKEKIDLYDLAGNHYAIYGRRTMTLGLDHGWTLGRGGQLGSARIGLFDARRQADTRFGVAALAIIALGAGFFAWRGRTPHSAIAPDPTVGGGAPVAAKLPSLVVLPLSNFANEPEYFVDGMTDALISALARIQGVRVISRQSAMHYKASKKLLPEIARELGVDFVVEGSVARVADRVRLNAQVVQADPETTLWSESFERGAADVIGLQNTFASAIASAIHVLVSPVEQTRMATASPIDPDTYEAYLQGRYYGNQFSEESLRKATGWMPFPLV